MPETSQRQQSDGRKIAYVCIFVCMMPQGLSEALQGFVQVYIHTYEYFPLFQQIWGYFTKSLGTLKAFVKPPIAWGTLQRPQCFMKPLGVFVHMHTDINNSCITYIFGGVGCFAKLLGTLNGFEVFHKDPSTSQRAWGFCTHICTFKFFPTNMGGAPLSP